MEEEFADILVYLIRAADKLGIDLIQAAKQKIDINEKKYPAEQVCWSSIKYTDYESNNN